MRSSSASSLSQRSFISSPSSSPIHRTWITLALSQFLYTCTWTIIAHPVTWCSDYETVVSIRVVMIDEGLLFVVCSFNVHFEFFIPLCRVLVFYCMQHPCLTI
jgi:hypothetical protein